MPGQHDTLKACVKAFLKMLILNSTAHAYEPEFLMDQQ